MCHLVLPERGVEEKRRVVKQNTGERHPMEAEALLITRGQLTNRVVYMHAGSSSLSFFPTHMACIHTIR